MKDMDATEAAMCKRVISTNAFNADARHSFDDFCKFFEDLDHSNDHVHQRFAAKSTTFIDGLSDRIAEGKLTDAQAHALLWPLVAVATNADLQYPCAGCSPREKGIWHDEHGKFSLSKQLEPLVSPRWEALKDLGNDALKAGDYKRAEALTDVGMAVRTFFKILDEGRGRSRTAARLADAEGDVREVILKFLPDSPVGEDYGGDRDVGDDGIAVQCPAPPPFPSMEPNLPRAICASNAAAAFLKLGDAASAVEQAMLGTTYCPEYIKGQHRFAQALKALGEHEAAEHHEAGLRHLTSTKTRGVARVVGARSGAAQNGSRRPR